MSKLNIRVFPVLALAALPMLSWGEDVPLSGQEVQQAWAGKELVGAGVNGARIFLRLELDGKASFSSGNFSDSGTWRLHEKGYCATWQKIRSGEERCFTVLRSGSSFKVLNPDGSVSGTISAVR
jgi:hypothetical protein